MNQPEIAKGKTFYPTVEALATEVAALLEGGDADSALTRIQGFVQAVILDRRAVAKVFADPTLDTWCQRIGATVAAQLAACPPSAETERVDCVVLATELYRTGGHTAVMEDLLLTGRFGPNTVVLLTDALHTADPSIIGERFGTSVRGEVAPAGSLADKLRWTMSRLLALRPRRLMLFNHNHDPVAIAAAQPSLAEETLFYHHADHQLCLGVTLAHTLHIDPHPMGFHHCRQAIGISENVYWPLVVEVRGGPAIPVDSEIGGRLRTCSSGSHNKFEHDYKYQYADVLPRVLSITGGTHFHIGPLSDETVARIHANLDALQVERERFVHIPWVRSVWKALREHRIDLYIASFPIGGGRVLIEAMGAGVPLIAHDCYVSSFLGGKEMLYPDAFVWRHPEQLFVHLTELRKEQLIAEGNVAREHYERHHTRAALIASIDGSPSAPQVLPMRPHRDDPLQEFLDDVQYALRDHLTASQIAPVLALNQRREDELATERAMRKFQTDALNSAYSQQTLALLRRFGEQSSERRRTDLNTDTGAVGHG
ncbi:hypothetical protein R69746_07273 [Paraburkholderia aspalathi]|uniref:glycosyltransferase family 4 protein n=1 Tax=Paraburkholderia aspalathi TaxID=1324617 RepID=UPI00190BBD9E|nr:glycosyltransferase family 4 protein [Paraburkholderia aspalathi]MBK3843264.1 glycosyltransferase family 4 protein [Paraburkholderia aspalathi]CAE6849234.1 hypothetical protein R69746_07273 [Paraburkholderia aspalathi]